MASRYLRLTTLLLLTAATAPVAAAQTFFTARLTPAQAGVETDGSPVGTAAMVLTSEGLRYYVTVDGLSGDVSAAHFHDGEPGVSGGVVHPISFDGTEASGLWPASGDGAMSEEMRTALLTGRLYVNVHTASNPAGEIRGQVLPSSGASLWAALTPEQETGEVSSEGSGTAVVQLTDAGAIYYATVDGLTGDIGAAHFHLGEAGVSGGVVRAVEFQDNTTLGVWTADDAQPLVDSLITHLLLGNLYLNVHTAQHGAGEIRGQLYPNGGIGFEAILNAENESGDVESGGIGTGSFLLTEAGLIYRVTVSGLTGPIQAAHFHRAPAGTDGGVVRGITFDGNTAAGVWRPSDDQALTPELIHDLLEGGLYVNVHTEQYPAGEVRGQVTHVEGTHFTAALTDAQSRTETGGSGTATMTLTDDGLDYHVTVDGLTGDISAAHFHAGASGVSGGVVHGITFEGNTSTGTWAMDAMPDSLFEALLTGGLYINVHTPENPAGEIRGQAMVSGGAGLRASLTNEQETAEVTQEGNGTAALTLTEAGLVYRATVTGLSGDASAAHFHGGPSGVSAGVVHGVTFDGATTAGVWRTTGDQPLTDSLFAEVLTGGVYLNVHTAANPAGEIRGQVELASGFGRAVEMDPESEGGDVESEGHGTASTTLTGAGLVFHATVSALTGDIAAAHFHRAPLGESGGVVRGVTFDGMNLRGVWRTSDDQPLDLAAHQAFFGEELYLNVHTAQYAAGEIRGQLDLEDNETGTAAEPVGGEIPGAFELGQNFPNPFNPETTITLDVAKAGHATLEVFDALGRRVSILHDAPLTAGRYAVRFDGGALPSGVYYYRLTAGGEQQVRSMLLLK